MYWKRLYTNRVVIVRKKNYYIPLHHYSIIVFLGKQQPINSWTNWMFDQMWYTPRKRTCFVVTGNIHYYTCERGTASRHLLRPTRIARVRYAFLRVYDLKRFEKGFREKRVELDKNDNRARNTI